MLYWKSRPINNLSKEELRLALADSVRLLLADDKTGTSNDVFSAFVTGMFCGLLAAVLVVMFVFMV